ncbi:MAG: cation:proton antiporter [Aquificaceae bacterium]|uniref:cation:proton antiporter n=1 Tax=Hydrogenobacter sp. Uz 6-8 TaxID=3384828 RepID=UPI00309A02F4
MPSLLTSTYFEFAFILLLAVVLGIHGLILRQPLIITYIVLGILLGPSGLGLVRAQDTVDILAQVGVAVLLFLVGLELNPQYVKRLGGVAVATGLGQIVFTSVLGFFIILLLGKDWVTSLYLAIALTFSSTVIIVKLLSDKKEVDTLHGRIAIGFLIVQDIAVIIALVVMSAFGTGSGDESITGILLMVILKLSGLALFVYVFMKYIADRLLRLMAGSLELLLLFAIAWSVSLAAVGEYLELSKELGAFLAGFSLSATHFRDAISARLTPIRDFLLLFFFIDLGTKFDLSVIRADWHIALILSLFVLLGNPLIVMVIMGLMGYRKKTGFLAGLTVAQLSVFSIIFVAMGMSLGHVGMDALSITTMVGLITIALSTYMILYSQRLYRWLEPFLHVFEKRTPHGELRFEKLFSEERPVDVIIFGLGRLGAELLEHCRNMGIKRYWSGL